MTGLAEVQVTLFLDNVDAEEGFEVVGFGENVFGLQGSAEFVDEVLAGGGDGKVVDMDAKEYTVTSCGVVFVEQAVVVGGASVAVFEQKFGEIGVEG